jgi:MFS family permease
MLSWVSFFADVSSEIVYPILPFLAIGTIGMSRTQLGVVEGLSVLLVSLMAAWTGRSSDRNKGRSRMFWIRLGYGLPIVGKLFIAFANNGWALASGRLIDRFGKGLRGAPRDAMIADAVSVNQRGQAFGLHRALDTAGALTGVIAAALLIGLLLQPESTLKDRDRVLRGIVLLGAVLGIASVAITWFVQDPKHKAVNSLEPYRSSQEEPHSKLPRNYWKLVAVVCLFAVANSSDTFLLLRAADLGFTPAGAILLYALYNVVYCALSYPIGRLSDRIGRTRIMLMGWLLYSVVYINLAWLKPDWAWAVWPCMGLYGVYMALTDGVGKAWVVDSVPETERGAALGYFYCLTGVSTLCASLIAGLLWDWAGPMFAFGFGALLSMLAAATLWSVSYHEKQFRIRKN